MSVAHPLRRIPVLGQFVDERFLEHRRRSTSAMGLVAAVLLGGLFEYRLAVHHVLSWDLLGILLAMVTVKLGLMIWYRLRD